MFNVLYEDREECVLLVILIFSPPAAPLRGKFRMKNEGIIHHNQLYYRHGERNKSVNTTEIFSCFKQLKYFDTIFIIHREQVLQIADFVRKGAEWSSAVIRDHDVATTVLLCHKERRLKPTSRIFGTKYPHWIGGYFCPRVLSEIQDDFVTGFKMFFIIDWLEGRTRQTRQSDYYGDCVGL